MQYDEARAARYDEIHQAQFAEAGAAAETLAALHAQVAERDGAAGAVLELGVGTGRLALPLVARGIDVWGIDNSEAMLGRLAGKPDAAAVRVVVGDFADVGELVESEFSVVFVAFNTLFELPDQATQVRCVQGVARRLTPGGVFVVEALAPDLTRLDQTVNALAVGPDRVVLQATRHDPSTQQVVGADVAVGSDGAVTLSRWAIRYVSVPELDLMVRLAGLRLRARWGGWHGQPFTATSSTHVSVYEREQA